jgi:MFS family permease
MERLSEHKPVGGLRGMSRKTFLALSVRNFRLFFIGQSISQVGNWLTSVAAILLVLHRTHSGLAVGILTACQFGPILVLGPWAGLLADRKDKRKILLVTQALEMLQSLALAALAFLPNSPLPAFYAVALAGGIMFAFDTPARRAFVAELVPPEQIHNAVTLHSALMTGSRVVGPALAGVLVTTVGFGWAFVVDAVSYLAVLECLRRMKPGELRRPRTTGRSKGQLRAGIAYIGSVPELRVPLIMMTVIGTLTFNFPVVLPLFIQETLHGGDIAYTLTYSVMSLGSLVAALAAAHRGSVSLRTIVRTSALFGLTMFALAAAPNLAVALPVALALGAASLMFMTLSTALVQLRADPAMRGRVVALQSMVFLGSTPIGGPLLGAICDAFGARSGLAVGGAAALAAAAWGYSHTRRTDELTGDIGLSVDLQPDAA